MDTQLFHIFRNTPLGRETLLQSVYFSRQVRASLVIYIPKFTKCLLYFDNDVAQVDLDNSYLTAPDTARAHATEIVTENGGNARFLEPKNFTASTLPDIPTNFDFMCCPRSISDLSSKIGLGYIGPRVRRIVHAARFPVLITSAVFKPWQSICVFFGGSSNALNALKLGMRISRLSGKPLNVFTYLENKSKAELEAVITAEGLAADMAKYVNEWHTLQNGSFGEALYEVPHDALTVLGAYGHGLIREMVFGSKMETIQSIIPNNMLIVGPKYTATT